MHHNARRPPTAGETAAHNLGIERGITDAIAALDDLSRLWTSSSEASMGDESATVLRALRSRLELLQHFAKKKAAAADVAITFG